MAASLFHIYLHTQHTEPPYICTTLNCLSFYFKKYVQNVILKGLSSEIGWAESGIIRKLTFKGRGARICNWFLPSLLM
jgi:hypothetical protein